METITLAGLTLAFVQMAKQGDFFSRRYIPVLSLLLGIISAGLLTKATGGTVDFKTLLDGIVAGLTASGIWSSTKAVIEN